jgi:hypothetical protein
MRKQTVKKPKKITVDGKLDKPEQKDLYDITGTNKKSPYEKQNESQYRKKIEAMESTELYEHAIHVGLIPIDNRRVLIQRLEREFARNKIKMSASEIVPALKGKRAEKFLKALHGKK